MRRRRVYTTLGVILVISVFLGFYFLQNQQKIPSEPDVYILVNQMGYFPEAQKVAIIRTDEDLSGQKIKLINMNTSEVIDIDIGPDLGEGYNFKHHFVINFTKVRTTGTYYFELGDIHSYTFRISNNLYGKVFRDVFNFFQLNHCGKSLYHETCHVDDGLIANGPHKGYHINVTGGWHDAGDYIKFTSPAAETLILLMETVLFNPTTTRNSNITEEINWGLEWMEKLWIPDWNELIFMVGNRTDHYQGFRLPENDTLRDRPVYVCEKGKGANVAGQLSAAFSLAYLLSLKGFVNPDRAEDYKKLAMEIYEFGEANKEIQEIGLGDWIAYPDWGWQDDMALAAVLLYNITGEKSYYDKAISYLAEYDNVSDVPYTISNLLAMYHLYTAGFTGAFDNLYYDLLWNLGLMHKDPLFWPWPEYYWGSLYTYLVLSFAEFLYRTATGSTYFKQLSINALDYIFGRNQWSICFVTGYGTRYPHHLHHQILYLKKLDVSGILAEGGVSKKLIQDMDIDILPASEDPYTNLQSDTAFYQDVYWNYLTNEPTIRAQALFAFVLGVCG